MRGSFTGAGVETGAGAGVGAGVETRPPNNFARAGGSISGTVVVVGSKGAVVKPGILRFAKLPFPILLRVAKSKAVSTGGVTIIIFI